MSFLADKSHTIISEYTHLADRENRSVFLVKSMCSQLVCRLPQVIWLGCFAMALNLDQAAIARTRSPTQSFCTPR